MTNNSHHHIQLLDTQPILLNLSLLTLLSQGFPSNQGSPIHLSQDNLHNSNPSHHFHLKVELSQQTTWLVES